MVNRQILPSCSGTTNVVAVLPLLQVASLPDAGPCSLPPKSPPPDGSVLPLSVVASLPGACVPLLLATASILVLLLRSSWGLLEILQDAAAMVALKTASPKSNVSYENTEIPYLKRG